MCTLVILFIYGQVAIGLAGTRYITALEREEEYNRMGSMYLEDTYFWWRVYSIAGAMLSVGLSVDIYLFLEVIMSYDADNMLGWIAFCVAGFLFSTMLIVTFASIWRHKRLRQITGEDNVSIGFFPVYVVGLSAVVWSIIYHIF